MTEYQAWRYLQKKWATAKRFSDGDYYASFNNIKAFGLCSSVLNFEDLAGKITQSQRMEMIAKIPKRRKYHNYDYVWQLNLRGAKARSAFCKRQAEKLRKKPK